VAISVVQTKTNSASSTSVTLTSTGTGNCLVVCIMSSGSSGSTPTVSGVTIGGSASNFAVLKSSTFTSTFAMGAFIWACPSAPSGQTALAVAGSNLGGNELGIVAYEVAGLATTIGALLDKFSTGGASSSSWTSGASGPTTQASEFVAGCASTTTGITAPGSPWTGSLGTGDTAAAQQIASSTGTFTYSGTQISPAAYAAVVVTLLPPAAGGLAKPLTRVNQAVNRSAVW
jgi:hypothetical protein